MNGRGCRLVRQGVPPRQARQQYSPGLPFQDAVHGQPRRQQDAHAGSWRRELRRRSPPSFAANGGFRRGDERAR